MKYTKINTKTKKVVDQSGFFNPNIDKDLIIKDRYKHTIIGYILGNRVAKFNLKWCDFQTVKYINQTQCPKTKKRYHAWHCWKEQSNKYTTVLTELIKESRI